MRSIVSVQKPYSFEEIAAWCSTPSFPMISWKSFIYIIKDSIRVDARDLVMELLLKVLS